ncbi:MAG: SDR family oxidoreductase [Pseudomonadota bacterium]
MNRIVITGANRGIGLEFVKQYAAGGAEIHAACRNPGDAEDLKAVEGNVTVHQTDISDHSAIDKLASDVGGALDIVIANAGVYGKDGADQSFTGLDFDGMRFAFDINTIGALKTLQAFTPHVKKGNGKKLVAITSKMGSIDDASGGMIAYRTSKTALNMAMCCAAFELQGEGIAVGTLHPGWVRTRMGGDSAPTMPHESAAGLVSVIESLKPGPKAAFKDFQGNDLSW